MLFPRGIFYSLLESTTLHCIRLLAENYSGDQVRTIHVTVTNLVDENNMQLSLFRDEEQIQREIILSKTMDAIRKKYGKTAYYAHRAIYQTLPVENETIL